MTRRADIYRLFNPSNHESGANRLRFFEVLVNLIGIVSVSAGTVHEMSAPARTLTALVTGIVASFFFAEYLLRLWFAPEIPHPSKLSTGQARLRWAVSPTGVIDLLAMIPALAVASGEARLGAESASVFVLLWVLKLATRAPGVELIARVIHNQRSALGAAAALFAIVLFSSATIAHWLEAETQPQFFGSIPSSLWWAVVTLTTTGYGDVVPQSPVGRLLGGVVMIAGISVLALLAGILANGFAEEVRRRRICPHLGPGCQGPVLLRCGCHRGRRYCGAAPFAQLLGGANGVQQGRSGRRHVLSGQRLGASAHRCPHRMST